MSTKDDKDDRFVCPTLNDSSLGKCFADTMRRRMDFRLRSASWFFCHVTSGRATLDPYDSTKQFNLTTNHTQNVALPKYH